MKPKKKTAKKKTRWESVADLVECHLDEEIAKDELIEKLMTLVGKPIIKISEMEFVVNEWKGNVYLNCRATSKDGTRDPIYDFKKGKMVLNLFCGHSYEIDMPQWRRLK